MILDGPRTSRLCSMIVAAPPTQTQTRGPPTQTRFPFPRRAPGIRQHGRAATGGGAGTVSCSRAAISASDRPDVTPSVTSIKNSSPACKSYNIQSPAWTHSVPGYSVPGLDGLNHQHLLRGHLCSVTRLALVLSDSAPMRDTTRTASTRTASTRTADAHKRRIRDSARTACTRLDARKHSAPIRLESTATMDPHRCYPGATQPDLPVH
jgi:hypothetical protein